MTTHVIRVKHLSVSRIFEKEPLESKYFTDCFFSGRGEGRLLQLVDIVVTNEVV